ncbi:MAG: hypothetical protein WCJ74_02475 [bacterium]
MSTKKLKKTRSTSTETNKKVPELEIKAKIIGYDKQGGTGPIYEPRYSTDDGSCQRGVGSVGMPW